MNELAANPGGGGGGGGGGFKPAGLSSFDPFGMADAFKVSL